MKITCLYAWRTTGRNVIGQQRDVTFFSTCKPFSQQCRLRQSTRTLAKMKLLTLNFLTCARKTCKSSADAFPLHPKEAELEQVEIELNPVFIKNMLPRLDWEAMKTLANEVCPQISHPFPSLSGPRLADRDPCSSVSRTCQQRLLRRKN